MSTTTPQARADNPLQLTLLLSRARTAARSGDTDGALRLLHDTRDTRDVLDLLARVHAQRGELTEAAACWRRVQEQHPRDPAAAAGLARVERLARRGPRAALARHRAGTAVVAAVCAVAAVTATTVALTDGTHPRPKGQSVAADHRAQQAADQALLRAHDQKQQQKQAVQRARDKARRAATTRALAHALQAPGLRPTVRGDAVEVTFTEGLFSEGARLTRTGARQLAVLGGHLTDLDARVEIYGQTATVSDTPRSGGSVLSLWRALVAARELGAASGRPLTDFTTASADQRNAPYPDAARNRTVTVLITPG
ncbi:tetratricopeptide repeat protein [Streptomyces prunicolor]